MLQKSSIDGKNDGGGPEFAEVFVIIWFGAVTITLNSKLLGGNISFFQSLCVLGYCILPLNIAMLICRLLLLAGQGPINFMIRLFVVLLMFAWSVVASTAFLADSQPPNRKALAVYPVFLFYFVISWMILTFTPWIRIHTFNTNELKAHLKDNGYQQQLLPLLFFNCWSIKRGPHATVVIYIRNWYLQGCPFPLNVILFKYLYIP